MYGNALHLDNPLRPPVLLLDGSGFIYRAFYAAPRLTTATGQHVGAIQGFCSMLIALLDKHRPNLFAVALDSGRHTFRSELFPAYKAHRSAVPEELKAQFPLLKETCEAFGLKVVQKEGFEADDIIATYARRLNESGFHVRIVSSDKDLIQLMNENVSLFDPIKSKILQREDVFEKYGILPSQMVEFQALVGDSADNIPGISGIGPVTASNLLRKYKTLAGIYENIDLVTPRKIKEKLEHYRQDAEISLKLAKLDDDVDIGKDAFDNMGISCDRSRLSKFLLSFGFDLLLARIKNRPNLLNYIY